MIVHPHASLDRGARLVPVQSHAAFHSDRSCRDVEGKKIMTTKMPTLVTAHDRALASGNAAIRESINRSSPLPHPMPFAGSSLHRLPRAGIPILDGDHGCGNPLLSHALNRHTA